MLPDLPDDSDDTAVSELDTTVQRFGLHRPDPFLLGDPDDLPDHAVEEVDPRPAVAVGGLVGVLLGGGVVWVLVWVWRSGGLW